MLCITARVTVDTKENQMSVNQRSATPPAAPASKGSGLKRIVAASMVGTVVEWYEFFLYATAATLVFGKYFFPATGNELDGIIQAFLTYAVGFVARPLGGIVFGQIGDKLGRKPTLQLTIVIIGVSTFLMGCLPGFADLGYLAPALLVLLRFIQGFALGGEWGGAVLLVAEHSPNESRGFWSSWPQAAVPVGNLLATLVLFIMSNVLSSAEFLALGLARGLLALRRDRVSSATTSAPTSPNRRSSWQPRRSWRRSRPSATASARSSASTPRASCSPWASGSRKTSCTTSWSASRSSTSRRCDKYDTSSLLLALLIAHLVHFLIIPQIGRLVDSWGRKPVYLVGAITGATWPFFAFPMFDTRNPVVIVLAVTIGLCLHAFMYAGQPALMAELFPTRMRYAGVSLGSQVTSIFAGSLAPLLATQWLKDTGSWVPTAIYLLVACAITAVAVLSLKETKGIALEEVDRADAEREGLAVAAAR